MVRIEVLGEPNERTPQSAEDLKAVAKYLHGGGEFADTLSDEQSWELYCMADGFGRRTPDELRGINDGWDWSHVRDSSPAALAAIRARLEEMLRSRH